MPSYLRYDDIQWEDFLSAEGMFSSRKELLPPEQALREVKLSTLRNKQGHAYLDVTPRNNVPFTLYFLRENDLVQQTIHHYLILNTETEWAEDLLKIAQRFRIDLKAKGLDSLFRIDPLHGVVVGSTREVVSRYGMKERTGCFATLVFANDPGNPMLNVQDYVEPENWPKFQQIFEKYNFTTPGKSLNIKKMFGVAKTSRVSVNFTYRLIRELTEILCRRYQLFPQNVSLIFEGVNEAQVDAFLFDRKRATFQTTGIPRFFTSTEELLV